MKTQIELTEMESIMAIMRNTLSRTESRLDIAKEMISECEDSRLFY